MAATCLPTADDLRQLLHYCPETGILTWKPRDDKWFQGNVLTAATRAASWNAQYVGREAFAHRNARGYRYARLLGRLIMGHRVVFCLVHGHWPVDEIDHINGVRDDNRIANIRPADRTLNNRNRQHGKGYHFDRHNPRKPWRVTIGVDGGVKHIGRFATEAEAIQARINAEKAYDYPSAVHP